MMDLRPAHLRRARTRRAAAALALAVVTVPWAAASAATTVVDCVAAADDPAAIQGAIDAAGSGDTIALAGTCDFSGAPAHGGDKTSIAAAAVTIGPSKSGLRITSQDAAQRATLTGSGTQTAFFVDRASGTTIDALVFQSFARPIMIRNAPGTTIGSEATGTTPDPVANRITGGTSMNSAILAVGDGGALTGLRVLGNEITYNPPGTPSATTAVVAIDVREAATGSVEDVQIRRNAVGLFSSDAASFEMNGVRVWGHTPNATRIGDVEISDNNLGRLEEAEQPVPGSGQVHAAGRAAVVLQRVEGLTVEGNLVRARLSATGLPRPGGGIIVGDAVDGGVAGNGIVVLADPTTLNADLGAVGVVDDLGVLVGEAAGAPATARIAVRNNVVGPSPGGAPGIGAQRGIVFNGAADSIATGNDVTFSSGPAINLGVEASGLDGATLQGTVVSAVACDNVLDGAADDPGEVSAGSVVQSAFPGGPDTGNVECGTSLEVEPAVLNDLTGALQASGTAWPNRTIVVRLTDKLGSVIKTPSGTVGPDGAYVVSVPRSIWGDLPEGEVRAVAFARDDPSGAVSKPSPTRVLVKDTIRPPVPTITAPEDGGEVAPTFGASGGAEAGSTVHVALDGTVTDTVANGAGTWSVQFQDVAGGAHTLSASSTDVNGNPSPGTATIEFTVDDSVPATPVITFPAEDELVMSNTVSIGGTTDEGTTVTVTKTAPAPQTVLGTSATSAGGQWSMEVTLPDGIYQVRAHATNGVGTSSPSTETRTFRVKTDFTAPLPPLIELPEQGATSTSPVTFSGDAEPGTTVRVSDDAALLGEAVAAADGAWSFTAALDTGDYTVVAIAEDASGNESDPSAPRSFSVDAVAPRVTITTTNLSPFLGTPTITGTAGDDVGVARVEIVVRSLLGGEVLDDAVLATPGGKVTTWRVSPEVGLGVYTISATAVDAAGNRSGTEAVTIIVIG